MSVTAAPDAPNSCANAHIGALFPSDLGAITFRGPIDVDSIGSLESVPMLVAAPVAPPSVRVDVTERIGQGAIWNAFAVPTPVAGLSASSSSTSSSSSPSTTADTPSVLKVTCVDAYLDQPDGEWEVEQVRQHIVKDIMAHGMLDNSVHCVPRLLGVWAGMDAEGREYWAIMEEDAGRPVEVEDMSDAQK
jgi:hypothetical protein